MKLNLKYLVTTVIALILYTGYSQENNPSDNDNQQQSNIVAFTPSKLLNKGQWDIKWFNNLYTQTKSTFSKGKEPRETFFTSSIEIFTGISDNKRVNIGFLAEIRSNVINDRNTLDIFKFDGDTNTARSGLTSIAPSIKIAPFKKWNNFSIQSSFHIPLIDNEKENGVFLDQKGFTWQNRFFYDYTFAGGDWQLFAELNTEYHFGKKEDSFANNSIGITPGLFLSYFPSQSFTILALTQHSQRIDVGNNFPQNYTALGAGIKYQLSKVLNIEALYTNFVDGKNTGLGESYNIGLRALF